MGRGASLSCYVGDDSYVVVGLDILLSGLIWKFVLEIRTVLQKRRNGMFCTTC